MTRSYCPSVVFISPFVMQTFLNLIFANTQAETFNNSPTYGHSANLNIILPPKCKVKWEKQITRKVSFCLSRKILFF